MRVSLPFCTRNMWINEINEKLQQIRCPSMFMKVHRNGVWGADRWPWYSVSRTQSNCVIGRHCTLYTHRAQLQVSVLKKPIQVSPSFRTLFMLFLCNLHSSSRNIFSIRTDFLLLLFSMIYCLRKGTRVTVVSKQYFFVDKYVRVRLA